MATRGTYQFIDDSTKTTIYVHLGMGFREYGIWP